MEVEVDFWENQRYKPLNGWNPPYSMDGIPAYSDISGEIFFNHDLVDNNEVYIPFGWEWSTAWYIDVSGKYGKCDAEGWSYASSFETLVENSLNKSLNNERSSLLLARRRRLVRMRVCTDAVIIDNLSNKIDWVYTVRSKMDEIKEYNAKVVLALIEYKNSRKISYEKLLSSADSNFIEVKNTLRVLADKLNLMKVFLNESGALEQIYAKKIQDLSKKWINAGEQQQKDQENENKLKQITSNEAEDDVEGDENSDNNDDNNSENNSENNDDSNSENSDDDDDNNKIKKKSRSRSSGANKSGFFYVVCNAKKNIATRIDKFSTLLLQILPAGFYIVIIIIIIIYF
jgi:hypothetical protein